MQSVPEDDIVCERMLEDHRTDGLRAGEGDAIVRRDGSILLIYGVFQGMGDADRAHLVQRVSVDHGLHWSDPEPWATPPPGALNVMAASLLRLQDGRMGALYGIKYSETDFRPVFCTSSDDGQSWTDPAHVADRVGFHNVNNDRLVQLAGGRILIPYAWRGLPGQLPPGHRLCGCLMSDDAGTHWRLGQQEQCILPANILQPRLMSPAAAPVTPERANTQEPGVVELLDGRVMMWCRSSGGYAYRAFSGDQGDTWSPFKAIPEFAMPCGPQSIKRLPGTGRLLMVYNDREGVPYGTPEFAERRPLATAVSDDEGQTWSRHSDLESASPGNCYTSIGFDAGQVLFTYYEGVRVKETDGGAPIRNLASFKLKSVRQRHFEGSTQS